MLILPAESESATKASIVARAGGPPARHWRRTQGAPKDDAEEIARRIADKSADYVLALKGNQASLQEDAALFFADPALAASCGRTQETGASHARIEERSRRTAEAD